MNRTRVTRRAPRLLLLVTVAVTAVVFLAPAAEADSGLSIATNTPADLSTVTPGDTISYSFTVTNAGPDPATSVELSDVPPGDTTYVTNTAMIDGVDVPGDETAGDPNPFEAGVTLASPVVVGTPVTFSFSATVNSPLADGTLLTNTASAIDNDDVDPPVSSAVTQTVNSSPSLSVAKTATDLDGSPLNPGDTIEYSVDVENLSSGTDTADDVEVTDVTPTDTTYVTNSATIDGVDVPGDETAGDPNPFEDGEALGDMAPGDSSTIVFQVVVDTPLPNDTVISNTATAEATNNPEVSNGADLTVTSTPGLTVDKTADPLEGGPVAPGDTITYTIDVSNDVLATDTATTVTLTDATPPNTTYVADSATVDTVTVAGATNPFETGYGLPDMGPGDQHTATFQVLVDAVVDNGTSIANTATLDSDQGSASGDATHTVQSQSTLTLVKTATPAEGGPVTPGTKITYSMLVSNDAAANEVADQLVLTDPTPAGTAYVGSSAAVDGTSIFGDQNPLAEGLDLPDLAPGESVTVTYDVVVNSPQADGTVISNLATLSADNHPDVSDEATHTVDSTPVMKVEVIASPVAGSQVKAGQTIVYTIKVSNDPAANGALTNVSVAEQPPAGTTYQPSSAKLDTTPAAPGQAVSAEVQDATTVSLGNIDPGQSRTVTFSVVVGKSASGQLTNTATVAAANHPTVVATTTHLAPQPSGGGGNGGGGDGSGGDEAGTTTSLESTSSGAAGESLAFTGLDLARLLLLALSLLLAGWVLISRGRVLQRQAVAGSHRMYEEPETRFFWDGAWFYPSSRR